VSIGPQSDNAVGHNDTRTEDDVSCKPHSIDLAISINGVILYDGIKTDYKK